jgi:hypothetical protein
MSGNTLSHGIVGAAVAAGVPELGTCASPPATAPNRNGAVTLAMPNRQPSRRPAGDCRSPLERSPSAAPRSTNATSAPVSGASSAVPSAANAAGKAENKSVIVKMSQT